MTLLPNTPKTFFLKHFSNTPRTLLKHFSNTSQTLLKHFSNTSQTLLNHFSNTCQTLLKHFSNTYSMPWSSILMCFFLFCCTFVFYTIMQPCQVAVRWWNTQPLYLQPLKAFVRMLTHTGRSQPHFGWSNQAGPPMWEGCLGQHIVKRRTGSPFG